MESRVHWVTSGGRNTSASSFLFFKSVVASNQLKVFPKRKDKAMNLAVRTRRSSYLHSLSQTFLTHTVTLLMEEDVREAFRTVWPAQGSHGGNTSHWLGE